MERVEKETITDYGRSIYDRVVLQYICGVVSIQNVCGYLGE